MKYVYLFFNWMFGINFLFSGLLVFFTSSYLAGLCFLTISSILLPPTKRLIEAKLKTTLSPLRKTFSITVLLLAGLIFIGTAQIEKDGMDKEKLAILSEKAKQDNIDYFNSNRQEIINEVKSAIAKKECELVTKKFKKFIFIHDKEFDILFDQASSISAEIQREQDTKEILSSLKYIATEDFEINRDLYSQLVVLHPTNKKYRSKLTFYKKKIELVKQKQKLKEIRKKQIEKQFHFWDGSHRNLEWHIKEIMNDPDSYEHVVTTYWDKGDHLVVTTTFRGKNAFGGVVKNSITAIVSLNGDIIQIID